MLGASCSPCCEPPPPICQERAPTRIRVAYYVLDGFNASYAGRVGTPAFAGYETETLLYTDSKTRRLVFDTSYYDPDLPTGVRVAASGFIEKELPQGTDFNDTSVAYKRKATITAALQFFIGSESLRVDFRNVCAYERQAGGTVVQNSLLSRVSIQGPRPGVFYANLGFTTVGDVFGGPFTIDNAVSTTSKETYDLTPTTFPIEIHAKGLAWGVNNGAYEYWELKLEIHGVYAEDLSEYMMGPLGGIEPNLP